MSTLGADVHAPAHHRPTVAVIDLEAVRANVRALRFPGTAFMAVVKANGYGHGAVTVARAAVEAGVDWLGVALVEEGIALREAGLETPILVLTEFPAGSEREALAAGLTPTLSTVEGLARLAEVARSLGIRPSTHVKVDTGMHRVGTSAADLPSLLVELRATPLTLGGLWTHFAKSDEPDDPFTALQLERFRAAAAAAERTGSRAPLLHAANSAAAITMPASRLDLVRIGIAVYGLPPAPGLDGLVDLSPVLSWTSRVSATRRLGPGEGISYGLRYHTAGATTVATVPVGYADGYGHSLEGRATVLIRGRRHPVAGAVTMDQIMIDCGDAEVAPGDEVVLIGRQGGDEITAVEVAGWMGTIVYEVVCGLSERVPRAYVGDR